MREKRGVFPGKVGATVASGDEPVKNSRQFLRFKLLIILTFLRIYKMVNGDEALLNFILFSWSL
jgi:hypothetical protein